MRWKPWLRKWITPFGLLFVAFSVPCWAQGTPPPLGATPRAGGAIFRVWAPFVDSVAVKVNDGTAVPLTREGGHTQSDDTVYVADVAGAKVGDRYKYVI